MKIIFEVTEFAKKRHFDSTFHGTKILDFTPEEFVKIITNKLLDLSGYFKAQEGYADFCRLIFVENFTEAKSGVVEITEDNKQFLRSTYKSRTENELPVLTRWLEMDNTSLPKAKYLMVIAYSKEQMEKEGDHINAEWGIVSINAQMEDEETPMLPITSMRNALGIVEGGSGHPIDREAYMKAVEYWNTHAIVANPEEDKENETSG